MADNFPNLGKRADIQIQAPQRVLNKINSETHSKTHINISKVKDEDKILNTAGEKQLAIYKGTPIRLTADFAAQTSQARNKWHNVFKMLKGRQNKTNFQPRKLYLAKLFRFEGKIEFSRQAKIERKK